ncbi:oligosaccharide flippase family protein [Vagococcus carniphilus]|uniref:lipopolysaccharide biosynthesis protein n=1 Tax=Vagococcus carniphilus TaxID=218144 RepID=UPI00288F6AE6|nr:oligosaccharide flippase family protein [Vagococcus carniphilus]MDT2813649.1 oligosaccharide flippase family protein [Vagococcus carniphilus]
MNNYKKLISNSAIFAVGNLGSKLIVIFLVPFYTYFLSKQEYGTVDLITTTTNMLLPVVSLSIFDAVLRFTMDKDENQLKILTNGVIITTLGAIFSFLVTLLFFIIDLNFNNIIYMYFILTLQSYQSLFSQYVRAIGKVKEFAINGILSAIVLSLSNILLIAFFKMNIAGYLLSIILSTMISCIYLISVSEIGNKFNFSFFDRKLIKKMIVYSLPLIPNSFMWWIINASNRYFIVYFISLEENGLFSVASKIPSVLAIFQMIFFQAWQLSAIDEFGSKKQNVFFSKVFEVFSVFMILMTSIILLFLKPIVTFILSSNFYNSWKFVPFLLLGTLFSSFSSFFGTNYVASKKTGGALISSVVGSIINIILCLLLIPLIGTNGAGIATMVSFLGMWLYRVVDTQKMILINIKIKKMVFEILLLFTQVVSLYKENSFLNIMCFLFLFFCNIKLIKTIYLKIKKGIELKLSGGRR